MRITTFAFALALLAAPAAAQEYAAPDRDLWEAMKTALGDIPASAKAHQQMAQIIQSVEREAMARAARAKAPPPKATPAPRP